MEIIRLDTDGTIDGVTPGDPVQLLSCLARQVEPAPGYALRSFFRMLEAHDTLVHLNAFFPDLLGQFRQGPDHGCRVAGIDGLVLEKTVEMVGFPGRPRLDIYRSLSGWDGHKTIPIRDYQVDMLLDTPLRLGRLKHVVFGDKVDVFEFDTVFTLFEFVEGIGWEFGFHGTPRQCHLP
ncbi:MAG: hypothetical protein WBY88_12240 [Desulfosarcina sp.]